MNDDIGSLCSGGGMLDRALESLFGLDLAWHAETDRAASQVLTFRWPGVPNLGDITAIGGPYGSPRWHLTAPRRVRRGARVFDRRVRAWQEHVDPVALLAAGFPCTPFSAAGKRGGSSDERHLWPTGVLPGIEALTPPVVVLENVPNLLAIEAGAVFGRVLADLDELGYSVAWTTVGACKVGACHHRHRFFALAVRSSDVQVPSSEPLAERHGLGWGPIQQVLFGDAASVKWPPSGVSRGGMVWSLPVDTCGTGGIMLPTPRTSDTNGPGQHGDGGPDLRTVISLLPTPRASDTGTPGRRASEGFRPPLSQVVLPMFPDAPAAQLARSVEPGRFGKYEPAVRRHEAAFGVPVPEPTELGRDGQPRLTAVFPEWMMRLPRGWVTDLVPRNDALRIAGNGVVGAVVEYALPTLPTFPVALSLLTPALLEVAA